MVIELDELLCRFLPTYNALISVVIKDEDAWAEHPSEVIRALQVLDFSVPLGAADQKGLLGDLSGSKVTGI